MSTFAELAARGQGVGLAFLLEGSTDLFVTTTYRYSTADGLFGGSTAYDARILGVGDLQRGFGVDGTLAASSVSVRLSNADGALDYLITTPTTLFKVRWRLKAALYDVATPTDLATKVLGVFVNLDFPAREAAAVVMSLADDSFGQAAELAIPPTPSEAFNGAVDTSTTEAPVPIALGKQLVPGQLYAYADDATTVKLVLCATTDTAAADPSEIDYVRITGPLQYRLGEDSIEIGTEATVVQAGVYQPVFQLYSYAKTASLAKDGRTWQVMYLNLYVENLRDYLTAKGWLQNGAFGPAQVNSGTLPWNTIMPLEQFNREVLPFLVFEVAGQRFGSRTYTTTGLVTTVRAPDIAYDLLRYYSRGLTSSEVNQASFTAATAAAPMFFLTASVYFSQFTQSVLRTQNGGALGRTQSSGIAVSMQGLLRKQLSGLCQGGFFDVVTDWNGQFVAHVLANNFTLQTVTPTVVDETLMANISDRIPSQGERWAPYNRVVFASNGRVVDNQTAITSWGVILVRHVNDELVTASEDVGYTGTDFGVGTFGGIGLLESVARPLISFEYPLDALNWELGDFLGVTWSRGNGGLGPWSGTVFRLESLTLHPSRGTVTVTAIWVQDLRNSLPYLLDNETYLVRTKNAGDSPLYMQDSTTQMGFLSGSDNFITMGVQPGDLVVLRDTSEAAGTFKRNRALRIATVTDGTTIQVTDPDLDFGFPTTAFIGNPDDWYIVRGATTYPTAISDPTNYPSGGDMYGKMSEAGTFSDSSTANTLQAG